MFAMNVGEHWNCDCFNCVFMQLLNYTLHFTMLIDANSYLKDPQHLLWRHYMTCLCMGSLAYVMQHNSPVILTSSTSDDTWNLCDYISIPFVIVLLLLLCIIAQLSPCNSTLDPVAGASGISAAASRLDAEAEGAH